MTINQEQQQQNLKDLKIMPCRIYVESFINLCSNTYSLSLLNYAQILKHLGRVLSEYNSLLYLQDGPKVRIIAISAYLAIIFFVSINQNYCEFFWILFISHKEAGRSLINITPLNHRKLS